MGVTMEKRQKHQDIYTIDELADLLGVDTWEKIEDRNPDGWMDAYSYAHKEAIREGRGSEEAEALAMEAEGNARSESYDKWHSALLRAAEEILGQHGLKLHALKTKPWARRIVPVGTWEEAAEKIRDTINGVGYFNFGSVRELRDSIPTTTRGAVLDHLHWMKRRPEVYGDASPERMMEDWDR